MCVDSSIFPMLREIKEEAYVNLARKVQGWRLKVQATQVRALGPKKKRSKFFLVLIYLKKNLL